MDDEGVDVVQLKVLQGLQDVRLDMLSPVVPVPELCLDEQILPLDNALCKQLLQSLANHVLVVVVVGAVNEPGGLDTVKTGEGALASYRPVSRLDGSDDGLLGLLRRRLPGAETKSGHLGAIIEADVEIVHAVGVASPAVCCPVLTCLVWWELPCPVSECTSLLSIKTIFSSKYND